jgi:hypothetical protein
MAARRRSVLTASDQRVREVPRSGGLGSWASRAGPILNTDGGQHSIATTASPWDAAAPRPARRLCSRSPSSRVRRVRSGPDRPGLLGRRRAPVPGGPGAWSSCSSRGTIGGSLRRVPRQGGGVPRSAPRARPRGATVCRRRRVACVRTSPPGRAGACCAVCASTRPGSPRRAAPRSPRPLRASGSRRRARGARLRAERRAHA